MRILDSQDFKILEYKEIKDQKQSQQKIKEAYDELLEWQKTHYCWIGVR